MIMADKIIEQRKKNGWSQEELAEKLGVSRQSVSKWEGAQSVPDLNKVIAMAGLFGVSTDYLLKDEVEELVPVQDIDAAADYEEESIRRVSMEESNAFLQTTRKAASQISIGVMMCILSPIFVVLGGAAGKTGILPLTEDQGGILGCILLLILIAAAVLIFVRNGMQLSKFGYLVNDIIDTEYGVTGMVRERRQQYEHTHLMGMTIGIFLCVLSAVPILACVLVNENNYLLVSIGVCVTLLLIAVGVWMIVKVSIIWEGYQKLLEEGDYSRKTKRKKKGLVSGIYWLVVLAIYFAYSFITMDWARSWIIWPVAGVMFAVVYNVEDAIINRKQR